MKRIIPLLMLIGGCANFGETSAQPIRLPLAQGVSEITVEPLDPAQPRIVIKDKERIVAIVRTLEGSLGGNWRRPADSSFPTEKYRLTIKDWNRSSELLLGDDWFGGYSGEKRVLRRLNRQEQEDLSGLLGVELKLKP